HRRERDRSQAKRALRPAGAPEQARSGGLQRVVERPLCADRQLLQRIRARIALLPPAQLPARARPRRQPGHGGALPEPRASRLAAMNRVVLTGLLLVGATFAGAAEGPNARVVLLPAKRLEALKTAARLLEPREPTWEQLVRDLPDPFFR